MGTPVCVRGSPQDAPALRGGCSTLELYCFLKALKAGIGVEVMKLEEFCFQELGDLTELREHRMGGESVSAAMLA